MEGDQRIDKLMFPVAQAIKRNLKGDGFTDIYNRAYEAVMEVMDALDTSAKVTAQQIAENGKNLQRAEKAEKENTRLREQSRCDLCTEPATYHLCQIHMDDMRFLDTFSTADNEYPIDHEMVLWTSGSDTYIGGYDKANGGWFGQEDNSDADKPVGDVVWCRLPDMQTMYTMTNNKGDPCQK